MSTPPPQHIAEMGEMPPESQIAALLSLVNNPNSDPPNLVSRDDFAMLLLCTDLSQPPHPPDNPQQLRRDPSETPISMERRRQLRVDGEGVVLVLRALFDLIDRDHNGCVTASELHVVLAAMGLSRTVRYCEWLIRAVNLVGRSRCARYSGMCPL